MISAAGTAGAGMPVARFVSSRASDDACDGCPGVALMRGRSRKRRPALIDSRVGALPSRPDCQCRAGLSLGVQGDRRFMAMSSIKKDSSSGTACQSTSLARQRKKRRCMNRDLALQSWTGESNKRRENNNVPHARHGAALPNKKTGAGKVQGSSRLGRRAPRSARNVLSVAPLCREHCTPYSTARVVKRGPLKPSGVDHQHGSHTTRPYQPDVM